MLKIKEDKMQELEKFGFEKKFYLRDNCYKYFYFMKNDNICNAFLGFIEIDVDTREINIGYTRIWQDTEPEYIAYEIQYKIFDLIKNDMVEKDGE